jgi:hypothetical protein
MSFQLVIFGIFSPHLLLFIARTKIHAFKNLMKCSHTFTRETGLIAAVIIYADH